jgi:hypothetical protein
MEKLTRCRILLGRLSMHSTFIVYNNRALGTIQSAAPRRFSGDGKKINFAKIAGSGGCPGFVKRIAESHDAAWMQMLSVAVRAN